VSELGVEKYADIIEVFEGDTDGQWYFRGQSNNGKILFGSEGYGQKSDAVEQASKLAAQLDIECVILGEPDKAKRARKPKKS